MYTCIGQVQIRIQFSGHVSALIGSLFVAHLCRNFAQLRMMVGEVQVQLSICFYYFSTHLHQFNHIMSLCVTGKQTLSIKES